MLLLSMLSGLVPIAALVVGVVLLRRWGRRRLLQRVTQRAGQLAPWARSRGFTLERGPRPDIPRWFPGVPYLGDPLAAVSNRVAWLLVSGRVHGQPVHLFELRCRIWHGTKARPYVHAVAALTLTRAIPTLVIKPRWLPNVLGPETPLPQRFFAAFEVQVTDPAFRARVLTPGLMNWFLTALHAGQEPWLRCESTRLLCCGLGTLRPDRAETMLAMLRGVHRSL
ncbi:hypothetical protein Athai_44020 [Actinocatenispora thailandica]|uniref:Uncharacterized protein n=1 Tax=Actinocatenispora thailandica TaxID=227318 RepID=A0A7R7DS95_9ACTN|nr:hypothetical protein [Actinocatenispora thailandica]BCJ36899.1 hypothetical protein Athai_44020 [Actinocatenispora thailandica]